MIIPTESIYRNSLGYKIYKHTNGTIVYRLGRENERYMKGRNQVDSKKWHLYGKQILP